MAAMQLLPLLGLVPEPTRGGRVGRSGAAPKWRSNSGIHVVAFAKANSANSSERLKLQTEDPDEEEQKPNPKPKAALVTTWFDNAFQYQAWPEVHRLLTERNVKSVDWQEARDLAQSGAAVLIDVREVQDYEQIHAQGSFCAPLFRQIQGNDLKANIRRLGFALITKFSGTERNPDFFDQALQAVNNDKEKLVVVLCDIGGTLSTIVERKGPKAKQYADPERRFGRASRSLRAVFELQEVGFKNVSYLSGGLKTWLHQDLPTEGAGN